MPWTLLCATLLMMVDDLASAGEPTSAADLIAAADLTGPSAVFGTANVTVGSGVDTVEAIGRTVGSSGRALPAGLVRPDNPYQTWSSYHHQLEDDRKARLGRQKRSAEVHSRQKRYLSFPVGSILYLEPNIYLPIYRSRQLSYRVELPVKLKWVLPVNTNTTVGIGRGGLSHDRPGIFQWAQRALEKFGIDGRSCLLRAICEVAAYPMDNEGLLGEIMSIVMSASRGSLESEEMDPYVSAEYQGRSQGNCFAKYPGCPISMFNLL